MDPAAGGEGEVLRAGQLGDRYEVIGDDASCYNSPAGGGSYWGVGRDCTRSSGRPVCKRTKPAQGTPRRPPKGAAAAEDSRAGWSLGTSPGGRVTATRKIAQHHRLALTRARIVGANPIWSLTKPWKLLRLWRRRGAWASHRQQTRPGLPDGARADGVPSEW
jgi:hypothetical protein